MIQLVLSDYCNDCPEFEPDVVREHICGAECITHIHCIHEYRCLSIYKRIKREFEESKDA